MGAFNDERIAIESLVQRKFASVPVAFEGAPFNQPTTAWARCTIRSGEGDRVDSTGWRRYAGVAEIAVFVPEKTGQTDGRNLADAAASVLREKQIVYGSVVVTFGSPAFRVGAPMNGWQAVYVDAPFATDRR